MTSSTEPAFPETADPGLTAAGVACLRAIAGHMIPPCAAEGLPGADDPAILAAILETLDRDLAAVAAVLEAVDLAAGGSLAALAPAGQADLLSALRVRDAALFAPVEAAVARGYYRDDRVLTAIGMEARPPFPRGYEVEPGDLSLLEPVRLRGRIYRDAG